MKGGESRRVSGEGAVDVVGHEREERPGQPIEEGPEIHRLITWAAWHARDPWWRVDRKLFRPGSAPVS